MSMRVLIVADDPAVRTAVTSLLSGQAGVTGVDQTSLETDLAATAAPFRPDVIVWDVGDPEQRAAAQLSALRDLDTPVIVLSDDNGVVAEAIAAGAKGALARGLDDPDPLIAAVRAVHEGLVVIDAIFPAAVPAARVSEEAAEELTPREADVLQLLSEGLSNKHIAQQLGISEHTVKFHVDAILGKLGAHSRTEAVTRAARLGLIVL